MRYAWASSCAMTNEKRSSAYLFEINTFHFRCCKAKAIVTDGLRRCKLRRVRGRIRPDARRIEMIQKILLPKLGQTMEEATVERWLKEEGEEVKRGEVILEITTDKATLEVESYAEGVLRKILARDGTVVAVNEPVGIVAGADEEIPQELLDYCPRAKPKKERPAATARSP